MKGRAGNFFHIPRWDLRSTLVGAHCYFQFWRADVLTRDQSGKWPEHFHREQQELHFLIWSAQKELFCLVLVVTTRPLDKTSCTSIMSSGHQSISIPTSTTTNNPIYKIQYEVQQGRGLVWSVMIIALKTLLLWFVDCLFWFWFSGICRLYLTMWGSCNYKITRESTVSDFQLCSCV